MKRIMVGVAAVCAVVVVGSLLIPEGEVVTLNVLDADGHTHPTQLWIVELEGVSYLRAANPESAWLARLRDREDVTLGDGHTEGHRVPYRAIAIDADSDLAARVGAAMAEKYGLADWLWDVVADREGSVLVRLEPRTVESSP